MQPAASRTTQNSEAQQDLVAARRAGLVLGRALIPECDPDLARRALRDAVGIAALDLRMVDIVEGSSERITLGAPEDGSGETREVRVRAGDLMASALASPVADPSGMGLAQALPHALIQALRYVLARRRATGVGRGAEVDLGMFDTPLALVKSDGEVLAANSSARDRFEGGGMANPGMLPTARDTGKIARAALEAGSASLVGPGGVTRLSYLPGTRNLLLAELDADPRSQSVRLDLATQAWGLTLAEREVAGLVMAGLGADAIALRRGTSRETARAQLRALREKSGEGSLLGLVAALGRAGA